MTLLAVKHPNTINDDPNRQCINIVQRIATMEELSRPERSVGTRTRALATPCDHAYTDGNKMLTYLGRIYSIYEMIMYDIFVCDNCGRRMVGIFFPRSNVGMMTKISCMCIFEMNG